MLSVPAGFEPARVAPKDTSRVHCCVPSSDGIDGTRIDMFESFSLTTRTRHRPFGNFSLASIGALGPIVGFPEKKHAMVKYAKNMWNS
jgi:hypothetical protein